MLRRCGRKPSDGAIVPPKFIRISHLTKVKKIMWVTCMYKKEMIVLSNKQQIKMIEVIMIISIMKNLAG